MMAMEEASTARRAGILRRFIAAFRCAFPRHFRPDYSVALLADTHFDAAPWERYRSGTKDEATVAMQHDYARNIPMWESRMPSLLAAAKRTNHDVAFAVHLGDIAQGDASDDAALKRMLADALASVETALAPLPLELVAGNHDIKIAQGGPEAFGEWLGRPTNRMFMHGGDAWLVIDSNSPPDVATIQSWLEKNDNARHTFLLTHYPLFPYPSAALPQTMLYGDRDADRRKLVRLLARRRAVVFAGHVHSCFYSEFSFPEGKVVQFVASSLWERDDLADMRFRRVRRSKWCMKDAIVPDEWKTWFMTQAAEYRPYLSSHMTCHAAGHFRIEVSTHSIRILCYGGDSAMPSTSFTINRRSMGNDCTPRKKLT